MAVGNIGKLITFSCSSKKAMIFREMEQEEEARWTKHERYLKKPLLQFLGRDAQTLTLDVIVDARHGVSPRKTIDAIRKHMETGKPEYFVMKGKKVCQGKVVITKMTSTWDEVWNRGELVRATVSLELMEYAE